MIRRVKRFLSAHEHPSSPRGRRYGRQASESSTFFPAGDLSPTRDLLDVPLRSPHRGSASRKQASPEASRKLHASLGELSTIRETSRTSTLQSLTPQSSVRVSPVRASPVKMPQVPEVLITAPGPPAGDPHHASAGSIQSFEFTGLQPSSGGQQEDPVGLILFPSGEGTPPGGPGPQTVLAKAEQNIFKLACEEDPFESDKFPKRWSLPGFLESSHASLEGPAQEPGNPEPTLLLDTETSSETSGINFVAGSPASPDLLYVMESLDAKETDIIGFNDDHTGESPRGMRERSQTWF